MGPVTEDRAAWVEAGGDAARLDVLSRGGRVGVFTNGDARILAAIHPDRRDTGTVGDWVGDDSVLRAAERWLAEQGCTAAEGPALLAPWFPSRVNLGPYEQPPLLFEPTERPERWAAAGYEAIDRYVSIVAQHDLQIKAGMDRALKLGTRGWRLVPVETAPVSAVTPEAFDRVAPIVHDLATRAYADVPGYLALPLDVVADWYRPHAAQLDPRLSLLAYDPQGAPAAFVLAVRDAAQPARKWFQILALAVAPEHRHTGVATWLVAASHQAARKAGYVAGVHAQIRVSGDGVEDTTWLSGDLVRRYALYRKAW
ncbi:MAG: GNAT family N-acetyltransferase [Myxococcota bacterium]